MSDILKTSNGDIAITNNSLTLVTGPDDVKQRLGQRLRTFYGEWFLNTDRGVTWIKDIMIKNPNITMVEGILKRQINNTPGVLELIKFDLTYDSSAREMMLNFTARSTEGEVTVEVVI